MEGQLIKPFDTRHGDIKFGIYSTMFSSCFGLVFLSLCPYCFLLRWQCIFCAILCFKHVFFLYFIGILFNLREITLSLKRDFGPLDNIENERLLGLGHGIFYYSTEK